MHSAVAIIYLKYGCGIVIKLGEGITLRCDDVYINCDK